MSRKILKLDRDNEFYTKELEAFCRQYPWKRKNSRSSKSYREKQRDREDCELIERCAREATEDVPVMYDALMKSMTESIPYKSLETFCGVNQFTKLRKKFLNILGRERTK